MTEYVHQGTRRACLFIARAIHQRSDAAVHHRTRTHHAGFQRDIQRCIQQTVVLQYQPALTQSHDFGMRSRIVAPYRTVPPFANHLIVMHQNGTHGHFALIPGAFCKGERMAHPVFMIEFKVRQRKVLQSESGRHYTHPL